MALIGLGGMRAVLIIASLLLVTGTALPAERGGPADARQALALIQKWVDGRYDNSRQAGQDLANDSIPDEEKHRLMHQLFVPVTVAVPGVPGYLVYQQSSVDGSDDPEAITRAGLLQFFIDDEGQLRQRELNFRELDSFKNLHRAPERLKELTIEQFRVDAGCDFLLTLNPSGTEISGPIRPGACRFFSKGLNKELTADDAVTIRPDEYWFLGRFVDEAGKVMWGNASREPVKMVRRPDPR
ncbi:MAG: chromophore lyase CpcT/CpeT [Chromatiales bacterium]|nr:chromophore lyase CpcT/CpeT [Chromatiales bacterium]